MEADVFIKIEKVKKPDFVNEIRNVVTEPINRKALPITAQVTSSTNRLKTRQN
jgi:hypothetical protein